MHSFRCLDSFWIPAQGRAATKAVWKQASDVFGDSLIVKSLQAKDESTGVYGELQVMAVWIL